MSGLMAIAPISSFAADSASQSEQNEESISIGGDNPIRWVLDIHEEIINSANNASSVGINQYYYDLVVRICRRCDGNWGSHKALHARGNYVATEKFLWRCASHFALFNKNSSETMLQYAQRVATAVRNNMPDSVDITSTNPYDKNEDAIMDDLVELVPNIINSHYTVNEPHQTVKGRCKYIMYGLLSHFFADLTAHRPIVPTSAIPADLNNIGDDEIDPCYFTDTQWSNLVTKITAQNLSFHEIPHILPTSDPNFYDVNSDYTDNENFYADRVALAKHYLKNFYNLFSGGYTTEYIIAHQGSTIDYDMECYDDYVDVVDV